MPSMSPGDEVTNILFRGEQWYQPRKKIKKVTFRNVSIQNMVLFQPSFTECKFVDCLFNGTRFLEVEFHKRAHLVHMPLEAVEAHLPRFKDPGRPSAFAFSVFPSGLVNFAIQSSPGAPVLH